MDTNVIIVYDEIKNICNKNDSLLAIGLIMITFLSERTLMFY